MRAVLVLDEMMTGLLVFCKGTGDLAHHLPRRVVARGQVIPRGRQQLHPSADQEG
jgi:hypothetical protein